jgi:hypothetical protein
MDAVHAFFLGVMVAWTPSLLILAWYLRHPPINSEDHPTAPQ